MFFSMHYCMLLDIICDVLPCLTAPSSCLLLLVVILSVIKNNKKPTLQTHKYDLLG